MITGIAVPRPLGLYPVAGSRGVYTRGGCAVKDDVFSYPE